MGKSRIRIARVLLILLISFSVTGIYSFWPRPYKWVFVYYMSYDNDLNYFGGTILGNLAQGISDNKIAVVTQADFIDVDGMRRIALYDSFGITKRKDTLVRSEDSADPNELKKYFDWVQEKWKAENYCVVFLNHGGTLNKMCKDERPFRVQTKNEKYTSGKWLPSLEVAQIVSEFNRNVDGKVRLLFLQQCGRSAIQNLYSFTNAAEYILSSPMKLWPPSTYYAKTLKTLTNVPGMSGASVAKSMIQEDEQYLIYTLIDCNELKKLPEKLTPVLDSFAQAPNLKPDRACLPIFEHEDEKFYDLESYFQSLSLANNNIADKELHEFFDWCDNHLIVSKKLNNYNNKTIDDSWHSGLSIYVPSTKEELGCYDFLPLYKQTNLENLMRRILQ